MDQVAFTAPHKQASTVGVSLLKGGANAVDAMIGAAAAISVCYPHMNSIGGDGFWLIHIPGEPPIAIDACGVSARQTTLTDFTQRGFRQLPNRGAEACITMAGTLGGWQLAREVIAQRFGSSPLEDILLPARDLARDGIVVTESLACASKKVLEDIAALSSNHASEFSEYRKVFTNSGQTLTKGDVVKNPDLANTFEHLIDRGLNDFYSGDLAKHMADSLSSLGSQLALLDFQQQSAIQVEPLKVSLTSAQCDIFNLPPPTQGLASLLILAIYDRLYHKGMSETESVHCLIEATKQAFKVREEFACDPSRRSLPQNIFSDDNIEKYASHIGKRASDWPHPSRPGDTVWMGCIDKHGVMVSFIQSVYWEFGAAVVIPETGIVWNNRGSSFNLHPGHHNSFGPGLKPFHTLNPAFAHFNDGSRAVYGTMGGEGQPQTQAAVFTRAFYEKHSLTDAIARGRWLLGKTWGEESSDLKFEHSLYQTIGKDLEALGHRIRVVDDSNEMMGHAGSIITSANGELSCASDPRSDGLAVVA